LLAILTKSSAIATAILGGKSTAINLLIAILFSESLLHYYCNTLCNTSLFAYWNEFRCFCCCVYNFS